MGGIGLGFPGGGSGSGPFEEPRTNPPMTPKMKVNASHALVLFCHRNGVRKITKIRQATRLPAGVLNPRTKSIHHAIVEIFRSFPATLALLLARLFRSHPFLFISDPVVEHHHIDIALYRNQGFNLRDRPFMVLRQSEQNFVIVPWAVVQQGYPKKFWIPSIVMSCS